MNDKMLLLTHALALSMFATAALMGSAHAATPASTPPMSHEHMKAMDTKAMDMKGTDAMDMKAHMMKSMQSMQNMPMTGDADKDFAMMMRMHHQCGVEMAQMQLANGKNTEMKAMATKIVKAQKIEIAQFDTWIAKQK
jgi:uncharacterized protein (DUF305 family)